MISMIESIVLAALCFFLFLIVQFLLLHFKRPQHRWRAISYLAYLFLGVFSLLFLGLDLPNWLNVLNLSSSWARIIVFVNALIIYVLLFFSYGHFYFLVDRGISARILAELEESPGGSLSRDQIEQKYNPRDLQKRRLDDMLYGGYVVEENGVYRSTRKGKALGKIFLWCKRYLHLYPGG